MYFEEWHSSQTHEAYDHRDCPHIGWEKVAWNAALDEAVKVVEKNAFPDGMIDMYAGELEEAIKELKE